MGLNHFFLILLTVVLYTLQSLFCKFYSNAYPGDRRYASPIFSVALGVGLSAVYLIFGGFSFAVSRETVLLGVCNGLALFGYNTFLILAMGKGTYSFVIISSVFGGILVPMAESLLLHGGTLAAFQIAAVAVMLCAIVLINWEPQKSGIGNADGVKTKWKFLALCGGLFLCNGLYGSLLTVQQRLMKGAQSSEMAVVTYLTSAILAISYMLFKTGDTGGLLKGFRQTKKSAGYLAGCCLSAACALRLLMYLLNRVNPVVLYTMDNGGVMLTSVLISFLIFREKKTFVKTAGLLLAFLSTVALGLF